MGPWKGVRSGVHRDPDTPVELYDLRVDPHETTDVATEHPAIAARILELMRREHTVSEIPNWNFGWNPGAPAREEPARAILEVGPGQDLRKQFVKDVEIVIDGGVLRLSGPANPLNGATVRFTRAGGELILERHTPAEFRRKHGRKIRTVEGSATDGVDFEVESRDSDGCVVRPIPRIDPPAAAGGTGAAEGARR